MATVNLGKIKLKWRGTWSSGGSYTADDVVAYTDGSVTSSHIAVAASSNQAPSSGGTANSSYWNFLAKGQATSPTTTQGDLIVRGASADERLAIGSAGQALKVNGSGNGLTYGVAGGLLQAKQWVKNSTIAIVAKVTLCLLRHLMGLQELLHLLQEILLRLLILTQLTTVQTGDQIS